ncbi:MAG: chemotaxis response regulator protein-glutamate methylesterase [Oscillatoria princeps RMCB-10]|nr:chemotaxis response regulator protein-glutamate methylesterase [Oscillatoria princeps RMCB-10]
MPRVQCPTPSAQRPAPSDRLRIAIVNDRLIAVEAILQVLAAVPDCKIAWVACNGAEAVTKCAIDLPDLILMDLAMPVMDGVEATRRIVSRFPCAIVVVTASVKNRLSKVFEAMGCGALDAVNTPTLGDSAEDRSGELLLAKIATVRKLLGKSARRKSECRSKLERCFAPSLTPVVAIGASTGGPLALTAVLSRLPKNFSAAVAIVQHIDAQFAPGLVEWLNVQSPLPVRLAVEGGRLEPGKVLVAGTNDHLVLSPDLTLRHTREPRDCFYRPSVDAFFRSAAKYWPGKGVGILLTGMGKDGAAGLMSLRRAGWHTIAQDRATCAVYGMPKAAAELGAAVEILPVDAVAPAIVRFFGS